MNNLYSVRCEPLEDLFKRIDSLGGWPLGQHFVTTIHDLGTRLPCLFTHRRMRDEWYTTICSADDYYWWKLSDEKKAAEKKLHAAEIYRRIGDMM